MREMGWGFAGVISPRICEGRESDEFTLVDLVDFTKLPLPCPKASTSSYLSLPFLQHQ